MKFDQNSAEAINVNFLQPLDDFASSQCCNVVYFFFNANNNIL